MKKSFRKKREKISLFVFLLLAVPIQVYAAELVTNPINTVYDIVAAIVTAIGGIRLLYGVFDWANAHAQHDTSAKSQALTGIVAGIIMILGSQLAKAILT